jgi:dihydrofolate reductase
MTFMPEFDVPLAVRNSLAPGIVFAVNPLAVYRLVRPARKPFEIRYHRIPESMRAPVSWRIPFALTHHARPPLELDGGTTFTFVTSGIEAALQLAVRAAGGKDVSLAGGARTAQQFLAAGLVDEMELSVVPALLGSGERLFENVGDDLRGLVHVRTVPAPGVTHLKFVRH